MSRKFSIFMLVILVLALPTSVALVKRKTQVKSLANTSPSNWKELVQGWLVTSPDSIEFFLQPNGDIAQVLIKADRWYYRNSPTSSWSSGQNLTDPNQTTNPFPADKTIDSFTMFYSNNELNQTFSKGSYWWGHKNMQPWTWTGTLFTDESVNSNCSFPLPPPGSSIDTITIFPYAGKIGVTATKNGVFWTKTDSMSKTYAYCGRPIAGYTGSFTGHTAFQFQPGGPMAELFTNGSKYWFFPNVTDRFTFFTGTVNSPYLESETNQLIVNPNSVTSTVSPDIFGVNLVWHQPYAPDPNRIIDPIRNLGISHLRFPGGCGGDAYNALNFSSPGNLSLDNFISILNRTNTKPLYTYNLEGEGNHANLNCHNLNDYPGTLKQVRLINEYFFQRNQPLRVVETGNEPWAGNSGINNWNETWTPDEYAGVIKNLPVISGDLIVATGNNLTWESSAASALGSRINYYQIHPYTFSTEGKSPKDFPLTQVNATSNAIDLFKSRSREAAITEYNLYCWTGVGQTPINSSAGGFGQALYLAQHLTLFAQKNIKYASYWHLFEGLNSTWKCGLIKETSPGTYSLTPAGSAFKLLSFLKNRSVITSSSTSYAITTLSTKFGNQISTVFVNPTSATASIKYNPSVNISSITSSALVPSVNCPILPDSTDSSLLWSCLSSGSLSSTIQYIQSGNILNLQLRPFSISVININ